MHGQDVLREKTALLLLLLYYHGETRAVLLLLMQKEFNLASLCKWIKHQRERDVFSSARLIDVIHRRGIIYEASTMKIWMQQVMILFFGHQVHPSKTLSVVNSNSWMATWFKSNVYNCVCLSEVEMICFCDYVFPCCSFADFPTIPMTH